MLSFRRFIRHRGGSEKSQINLNRARSVVRNHTFIKFLNFQKDITGLFNVNAWM